jgi:hypothetical protein
MAQTLCCSYLLHLALQPWVSLGLLDNQSSVKFGRWESTAVRYSSLCNNTHSDTPECPERLNVKISTAPCKPLSIGLSSADGDVLTPIYDTVDRL